MARYYGDQVRAKQAQQAFATGEPCTGQRTDIKNVGDKYNEFMTPAAEGMQDALVRMIGTGGAGNDNLRNTAGRMAASDEMLKLLKYLPAGAVGAGSAAAAGDLVFGEEDFGNKAMDALGMGATAAVNYGINRGPNKLGGTTRAGQALATAAMLVGGKNTMDTLQGIF